MPGRTEWNRADYALLKLFQLSLLWRAQLSTDRMFRDVALGPHAERIRRMLVAENPGRVGQYGCMMGAAYCGTHRMGGLVVPARVMKRDGQHRYSINFAGFYWLFVVSGSMERHRCRNYCVQQDGRLPVYASDLSKFDGFRKFTGELIQKNQAQLSRMGVVVDGTSGGTR